MVSEVDSDPHAESSDTQITPGVLKANAAQYIECTVIEAQWGGDVSAAPTKESGGSKHWVATGSLNAVHQGKNAVSFVEISKVQ